MNEFVFVFFCERSHMRSYCVIIIIFELYASAFTCGPYTMKTIRKVWNVLQLMKFKDPRAALIAGPRHSRKNRLIRRRARGLYIGYTHIIYVYRHWTRKSGRIAYARRHVLKCCLPADNGRVYNVVSDSGSLRDR